MLCVETIGKIRRRRLVKQDSISGIARDLGLSRNTVKKALRSGVEPFEYRREHQPRPQLGPYLGLLEEWLAADAKLPLRERRTAQRLYEGLRIEGYSGAVDSVRRHVRQALSRTRAIEAFIPQSFAPGEAYQFDWSHEHVELGGVNQVVKVAHLRLAYSRAFFLVAFPRESQEMVFEAHAQAFAHLGGIPRRGIYDNMKTAVEAIFTGKERRYNRRFLAMCSHYLIEPTACTPASGWEKGQVENQVGTVRGWLFTPKPRFESLAELNAWLAERCVQIAASDATPSRASARWPRCGQKSVRRCSPCRHRSTASTSAPAASPRLRSCRSSATATASSAATPAARWRLRAYATRIVVVAEGVVIGEHARRFDRYQTLYNPWHYVPALEHKPGALRNGAPFKDWNLPASMTRLRERLARTTMATGSSSRSSRWSRSTGSTP